MEFSRRKHSFSWLFFPIGGAIAVGGFSLTTQAATHPVLRTFGELSPLEIQQNIPPFSPQAQGTFSRPAPSPINTAPLPFQGSGFPPTVSTNRNVPSVDALDAAYRLGAGDTIQLRFFNVAEYNGDYPIDPTGSINVPLLGRLYLSGLTVKEAGDRLTAAYASELRYPEVEVILIARRPLQVVIQGEISQPGLYTFPANVQGQAPKLFQALQTAGGMTPAADLERIQILRNYPERELSHTVSVNLLALLNQGDLTQNLDLRDGDVIAIPPAETINAQNIKQLASSNVRAESTEPIDVSILGEVSRPGPYRFSPTDRPTLITAIQQAAGLSPFADIRKVSLERTARDGSVQQLEVDLFAILDQGNREQDIPLQTGDIIDIPMAELTNEQVSAIAKSTLSSGPIPVAILGEVKTPGSKQLPPNTSLNQAILASGGFSNLARKQVKLLRFNADGSVTERTIDVDLTRTLNSEDNPLLRPNDIVMVGKSTWGSIKETLSAISQNVNFLLPFLFFLN